MAEANRDEARRCLQLSQKLLTEDELDLSLKYAEKSLRLYASEEAEKWLAFIRQKLQTRGTPPSSTTQKASVHDSRAPREEKAKLGDEVGTSAFTKEQVQQVRSFMKLNKEDYYGVLGLKRGSDEMEIKRAYRRFHPDKNQAPGADEAFKIVSRAFSCLGDADKRAQYDRFGMDQAAGSAGGGFGGSGVRFRSSTTSAHDVSPEELFNMFFGNMDRSFGHFGSPMGGFQFNASPFGSDFMSQFAAASGHARRRRHNQTEPPTNLVALLIQFVPMMVLALIMYLASFSSTRADNFSDGSIPYNWDNVSPHLSFSTTKLHTNGPFSTDHLKIIYYSTPGFEQFISSRDRRPYEAMLERTRIQELQKECQSQQRQLQMRIAEAASGGDSVELEKLKKELCNACESLHHLGVSSSSGP